MPNNWFGQKYICKYVSIISKRSKESEGNSITDKFIRFTHPEYQIRIYDIPGFENESTVLKVKKLLEKYNIIT